MLCAETLPLCTAFSEGLTEIRARTKRGRSLNLSSQKRRPRAHPLLLPDEWVGREHLQGMTIRRGHFTYKNKANQTATSAW